MVGLLESPRIDAFFSTIASELRYALSILESFAQQASTRPKAALRQHAEIRDAHLAGDEELVRKLITGHVDTYRERLVSAVEEEREGKAEGVFRCGQAAARTMPACGSEGSIVNLASIAGKSGRLPYLADYVASKFAVVASPRRWPSSSPPPHQGHQHLPRGFVVTPMHDRELAREAALRGTTIDAVRQAWIDDTPIGLLERPEDVAEAVAFLISSGASYFTGEALVVNGGVLMD